MLKNAKKKLFSKTGESIGETLIALLISALALLMLAGAVSSAGKIVTRNRSAMNDYYGTKQGEIKAAWDLKVDSIK